MRNALFDTGALVAIVNRRDRFHAPITDLLRRYDGRFLTTWPVVAEACSFMPDRSQARAQKKGLTPSDLQSASSQYSPVSFTPKLACPLCH